ncbi:hypothetical protein KIPB_004530 [Kipferlia bialata]|uniref:SP-RING-type domain-containing protein n=1 Tax=Kipferlia bialata TaxID=797122 RepID=A0A9K3CX30_9EUKA|nr:hypothetical protein KIPB_004530 [Kipferlia bialata]|eukprot:g4530.t1
MQLKGSNHLLCLKGSNHLLELPKNTQYSKCERYVIIYRARERAIDEILDSLTKSDVTRFVPSAFMSSFLAHVYTAHKEGQAAKAAGLTPGEVDPYPSSLGPLTIALPQPPEAKRPAEAAPSQDDPSQWNLGTPSLYDYETSLSSFAKEKAKSAAGDADDDDDDLCIDSLSLPLRDPLTLSRIEVPVRGDQCTHTKCLDLRSFLTHVLEHSVWQCPVCKKGMTIANMQIDAYLEYILALRETRDLDKVEVNPLNGVPDLTPGLVERDEGDGDEESSGWFSGSEDSDSDKEDEDGAGNANAESEPEDEAVLDAQMDSMDSRLARGTGPGGLFQTQEQRERERERERLRVQHLQEQNARILAEVEAERAEDARRLMARQAENQRLQYGIGRPGPHQGYTQQRQPAYNAPRAPPSVPGRAPGRDDEMSFSDDDGYGSRRPYRRPQPPGAAHGTGLEDDPLDFD